MKNILIICLFISLFACSKSTIDKPVTPNNVKYIGQTPEGCKIYRVDIDKLHQTYEPIIIICNGNWNASISQH